MKSDTGHLGVFSYTHYSNQPPKPEKGSFGSLFCYIPGMKIPVFYLGECRRANRLRRHQAIHSQVRRNILHTKT
jgi:hypothetical protein